VDGWIDELAAELGEDPLTQEEVVRLLGAARDVAHRVERKTTPLAAFLLGTAIGRAEGSGMDRPRAMADVFDTLERALPDAPPDAPPADLATPQETAEARGEDVDTGAGTAPEPPPGVTEGAGGETPPADTGTGSTLDG
jgi:hypothetical protein